MPADPPDSPPPATLEGEAGKLQEAPRESKVQRWFSRVNPVRLFRPNSVLFKIAEGRKHVDASQFAQATLSFTEALELDPTCAEAFLGLGLTGLKQGSRSTLEEGLRHVAEGITHNPLNEELYILHSQLLTALRRGKEAMREKQKALSLLILKNDPKNVRANNNIGTTLAKLGHRKLAEEFFLRALQTDPRYSTAWRNIAVMHLIAAQGTEDPEKRGAWLQRSRQAADGALAIGRTPTNLRLLARVELAHGHTDAALHAVDEVLAQNPEDRQSLRTKQVILEQANRLMEAQAVYDELKGLAADPV